MRSELKEEMKSGCYIAPLFSESKMRPIVLAFGIGPDAPPVEKWFLISLISIPHVQL